MNEEEKIARVKVFLDQGQILLDEIAVFQEEILRLRDLSERCTTKYGLNSRRTQNNSNRIEDIVTQIVSLEEVIQEDILTYAKTYRDIKLLIRQIDDSACRVILERKYLLNMTWSGIAAELGYAEQHIRRLHRKALLLGYEVLNKNVRECSN